MRIGDVFTYLESLHPNSPASSVNIDASFASDTFRLDSYQLAQRPILDGFRELARWASAVFYLTASTTPDLEFEPATTITSIDASGAWNPADHQYILSTNDELFSDDDALKVRDVNIGVVDTELYTTFMAIGKDPSIRVTYTNCALVTDIGREIIKQPDTFPQEENIENLREWVVALNDIFGQRIKEGVINIEGYGPLYNGRLDSNAIFRVISDQIEDGTDLTGTNNVFRVESIVFKGEGNITEIHVSNRTLYGKTEEGLEELRNVLNGIETTNITNDERHGLSAGSVSGSGVGDTWLTVFVGTEEQLTIRVKATMTVRADGYLSFSGTIPAGLATTKNDEFPIDKMSLYNNRLTGAGAEQATVSLSSDPVWKWEDTSLHLTIDIDDSDS
jgi:hypothetical protein